MREGEIESELIRGFTGMGWTVQGIQWVDDDGHIPRMYLTTEATN